MKKRIICDTCSAIKLASFKLKLFQTGVLNQGDIVLHPTIFSEIKKWSPEKKEKYREQISNLEQVRSATGLRPDRKDYECQEIIVKATRDSLNLSVGRGDIDQLISALFHDLDLITNDGPFARLADALEVVVYEAEETIVEAINQGVVTIQEAQNAIDEWEENGEKRPSPRIKKVMIELGLRY